MKRFRRSALAVAGALVAGLAAASPAPAPIGELRVEIHSPARDALLPGFQTSVDVEGGASIFGGVKHLDLVLLLDTSKSLQRTDPRDYRSAGAVGLVANLPAKSDIQLGVVGFDDDAELLAPLTPDRERVVRALRGLDRRGATDLAEGIRSALAALASGSRPDSSRVILLFTDGKSDEDEALAAAEQARARGVAIHTLQLGSNDKGAAVLSAIAAATGGSYVRVSDPARLPEAFLALRTTGVERVVLHVNGSAPIPAQLAGGSFRGRVPLRLGVNRIVAVATSLAGEIREDSVAVTVSGPLEVSIETPVDGALAEREEETLVEGTASAFAGAPDALLAEHPDRGVASVVLRVNGSPPLAAERVGGRFRGRVRLAEGENRIEAIATSRDGRTARDAVVLTRRAPGCAELAVEATRDGRPALSLSERAVEIVFDASNSMWAQIDGRSKISIGKQILDDALSSLPGDVALALRVYGHQQPREARDCRDSELLVPFAPGNRGRIREAVAAFRPRGQTPIAYSLEQVAADFGALRGERAVVLVTDGLESCGGDPVAVARELQAGGAQVPVHVIGFGLGGGAGEDPASLRAIAETSGGRFLTARNADELRDALSETVGTPFGVWRDGVRVAGGVLGARDDIALPEGDYRVRLESRPPYEIPVSLVGEERATLRLEHRRDGVFQALRREPAAYRSCGELATAPEPQPLAPVPVAPAGPAPWPDAGPPPASPGDGRGSES